MALKKRKNPNKLIPPKKDKTDGYMNAKTVALAERRYKVIAMRRDGHTTREIAHVLDISESTVIADLQAVLTKTLEQTSLTTEQERLIAVERLDRLIKNYTPLTETHLEQRVDPNSGLPVVVVTPPSPVFAKILLETEARRAKLLALDTPEVKKVEVTGIRVYEGVDMDQV